MTSCPQPGEGSGPPGQGSGPPGQGGDTGGGESCDGSGGSATYTETMVEGDVDVRRISASGCPNHFAFCTGKTGMSHCGGLGAASDSTEGTVQDHTVEVPAYPVMRDTYGIGVSESDVQCKLGKIAIALNGVSIYGGAVDQQCTSIDADSIEAE